MPQFSSLHLKWVLRRDDCWDDQCLKSSSTKPNRKKQMKEQLHSRKVAVCTWDTNWNKDKGPSSGEV